MSHVQDSHFGHDMQLPWEIPEEPIQTQYTIHSSAPNTSTGLTPTFANAIDAVFSDSDVPHDVRDNCIQLAEEVTDWESVPTYDSFGGYYNYPSM